MRASSSPWYEAWQIKLLAIALGAYIIYLGQTRYEQGLRKDELRQAGNPKEDSVKPRFDVLAQIDLAGKTEANQFRELESISGGMHFLQSLRSLADVRGLICVSIPQTLSGKWIDSSGSNSNGMPTWVFEIAEGAGLHVKLIPLPSPTPGIVCLRVPYSTASGFDHPELWVERGGANVAKLPLSPLRSVPRRRLDAESRAAPIEVSEPTVEPIAPEYANAMWSPTNIGSTKPVQYHVRLKSPLPPGQTAFVRLVSTEYAPGLSDDAWTQFKNSEAYVTSPCGLLAKQAELRVIVGTPTSSYKTVVAHLGQIIVQFGQPTFIVNKQEKIRLSPSTLIDLRPQGPIFKRPPHHPNLAIHIDLSVPKHWSGSMQTFPHLVEHVEWVAPSPASLGLNSIWLPWGKVLASSRLADSVQTGPLTATLRVRMTTLHVTQNLTAVVPIEREG